MVTETMATAKPAMLDLKRVHQYATRAVQTFARVSPIVQEISVRLLERLDYMKISPTTILNLAARNDQSSLIMQRRFQESAIIELDPVKDQLSPLSMLQNHVLSLCAFQSQLPFVDASFDLVLSNLLFHCENDLEAAFKEIHRVLKPNGLILFSMLGSDTLKELRESFNAAGSHHNVHDFWDMHDVGDLIVKAGLTEPVVDMEHLTLRYSEVSHLLKDLKLGGLQNARDDRARGLMGKERWKRMHDHYEQQRSHDKIHATLELIYGVAWKAPQANYSKANDVGEVLIPLHRIQKKWSDSHG